jgi:gephyrin
VEVGKIEIDLIEEFKEGQWIRPVGSDIKKDSIVLHKGMKIDSAEIGILASVGKVSNIKVYSNPKVGILSTGSELVPASQ